METNEVEELKSMLRHLHSDVSNIVMKQEVLERKIEQLAFLIGNCLNVSDDEVEKVTCLDESRYPTVTDLYTPIDEVDKADWEEHNKQEIITSESEWIE